MTSSTRRPGDDAGLGRSVRAGRYTARSATAALSAVLNQGRIAAACRAVAARVADEHPIDRTCELIEALPAARSAR